MEQRLQSLLFLDNHQITQAVHNSPALSKGACGNGVRALQLALYVLGFQLPISIRRYPLSADGIFGAETDGVVRAFQHGNGLTVDGLAGAKTIAALDRLLMLTRCDPLRKAVYDLQQMANRIGMAMINNQPVSDASEFSNRLTDLSHLVLGNPMRLLVRIRQLLGLQ
jgi:peptidoglycan hydrolase-like protein with peptidoglycan-binding domain